MAISNLIAKEFGGTRDLSGIGGVETGSDAAEFLLLGANSVQVRFGVKGLAVGLGSTFHAVCCNLGYYRGCYKGK